MTDVYDNQDLYQALKELSIIDQKQLDQALESSKEKGSPLGEVLLEKDLVSDENLGKVIADLLGVPFVYLSTISIPSEILGIIPEVVAKKQKIVAFGKGKDGLKLAMADPRKSEIAEFVAKKIGEKVSSFYATERDIERTLGLYKKDLQKSFDELLKGALEEAGKVESKEAPISKIVDLLLQYAYNNSASDVHIEPGEESSLIRFRIDGVLHDVLHFPKDIHDQVVTKIKVLSKLRTDEHLSAQDGKMQMKVEEEDLDIRVSIVPVVDGEKVVLRLLSSRHRQFSLNDLGMSENNLEIVKKGFSKPFGMVLATGPTGSGKTTTIYAILKILNTREKNIATIEDPVEYDIDGINQIQVNPKTNLTFADGLRSILRQDPDIVFVGEVRDQETAAIAINAAMTGHLVLSTLHTNDAATSLPRLLDMGVEPFLVASTVNVIIAQRLVRKICEKCRTSINLSAAELGKYFPENLVQKYFKSKKEVRVYQGKGCSICHDTGYLGRVGIFEVLEIGEPLRELITAKADADTLKKRGVEEGMLTMLEDGMDKIERGLTTIEEVIRVTKQ